MPKAFSGPSGSLFKAVPDTLSVLEGLDLDAIFVDMNEVLQRVYLFL